MSKKNKKHHDQEVYDNHQGFREGVTKYFYFFEHKGMNIMSFNSNLDYNFKENHFVNHPKGYFKIRRIQQNWSYGRLLTLLHLEEENAN